MSDEQRILRHLERYGKITVKECQEIIGTTECRKYISNLRKKGIPITANRVDGTNRYGEAVHYNEYIYAKHLAV